MRVKKLAVRFQVADVWLPTSDFSAVTGPPAHRYQDAFRTPGIIPSSASWRKQIRHKPNRRKNARERPQRPQRLWTRTLNFGFRLLFSIIALRAI